MDIQRKLKSHKRILGQICMMIWWGSDVIVRDDEVRVYLDGLLSFSYVLQPDGLCRITYGNRTRDNVNGGYKYSSMNIIDNDVISFSSLSRRLANYFRKQKIHYSRFAANERFSEYKSIYRGKFIVEIFY